MKSVAKNLFFSILLVANFKSYSQEQRKGFSFGIQEQTIFSRRPYYWKQSFSYSIGAMAKYRFSDSSRVSIGAGLLFLKPIFIDYRNIVCDPISCAPTTIKLFNFQTPVFLQYNIFKKKKSKFHPFIIAAGTPTFLAFAIRKFYDSYGSSAKVYHTDKYSILEKGSKIHLLRPHFTIGFGINKAINKKLILNLALQSQLYYYAQSYYVQNRVSFNGAALTATLFL